MSKLIYVAGPYSGGDTAVNVRKAIDYGMKLNDEGHYAVIPHLTHFVHLIHPRPYLYWIELDLRALRRCHELHRLPGESPGADLEVKQAVQWEKGVTIL